MDNVNQYYVFTMITQPCCVNSFILKYKAFQPTLVQLRCRDFDTPELTPESAPDFHTPEFHTPDFDTSESTPDFDTPDTNQNVSFV